jgi:outer membrane protein OmpA-like peptidoglycan-associated protein
MKKPWIAALVVLTGCGMLAAQEMNPTQTNRWPQNEGQPQGKTESGEPLYKITVVGRDIPAINYFHRSGSTKIGFEGTNLLPQAKGSAQVNSLNGRTEIKAHFEGLEPANNFGIEYLTYVLWAITPEGRPINLGEVLWRKNGSGDITVTTGLQSFGLILTAEPYFAVTMPSDVVVLQNRILKNKTAGVLETVNAHFNLLPRGAYTQIAGQHTVLHPITRNDRSPLELYEAINAVQIAEAGKADQYAPDTMATAKQDLQNAKDMDIHQKQMKQEITYAREAVQTAEDARILTIRRIRAEDEARQKAEAEAAQQQAKASQLAEEQAKLRQQEAQQRAEAAQLRAQQAQQQEEAARLAAEKAHAQQAAAEQAAQQANQQTAQMRERLRQQLSQVLQTQESARGIIVNMSDVLFDFGKYTLKPDAQIKLAKVAGILLTYPNLKLQVEGYTDNVGSDAYNLDLSQKRATAVQAFLISQGVSPGNITSQGYGKADPVADNSTSAGRAQNRRVQLVVSGQSIGVQEQGPSGQGNAPEPNGQPMSQPNGGAQPQTQQQTNPDQQPQPQQQPPPQPQNPTGQSNPPQR